MSVNIEKELLREQMLRKRLLIPISRRNEIHARLTKAVTALPAFCDRNAALLCYASFGLEPDTWDLLRFAWKVGKHVALPRCEKDGRMAFYTVRGEDELRPGMYGISEPAAACRLYVPQEDDLCVVPGVAFDREGYRLGYGGGYYDRYLQQHKVHTVGLCYPDCMTDVLPRDRFDIPVEQVII